MAWVSLALAAGGFTKGVVGIGLPLTAISIMAPVMDARMAVALVTIPILTTNLWQAFHGGHICRSLKRFWPLVICLPMGVILGVKTLSTGDQEQMRIVLGICIVVFVLFTQFTPDLRLSHRMETFLRPVVGFGAGFIGGLSSFFGPLITIFLISLNLRKEEFIAILGVSFFAGIVPMIIFLVMFQVIGPLDLLLSASATLPSGVGLILGQRFRNHIPEKGFRRILLFVFVLSGINLIRQGFS